METSNILSSGAALVFVLCLIGGISLLLKRVNFQASLHAEREGDKIKIVEIKKIDPKNKIVLLEKDGEEKLVLLSSDGNLDLGSNNIKK